MDWININDRKPHCWETGNWDGKKSDLVLCKDINNNYNLAYCYEGTMDGSYYFDWYDRDGYELKEITYWVVV